MTPSPNTTRTTSAALALLTLVVACVAALSLGGSASAATPCGKKVLADWYDNGRIDRLYPLHCYEEAIDAIPPDLRDYVDARDVIERALQAAVNGKLAPGGADPTPGDSGKGGRGVPGGNASGGPNGGSGPDGTGGPQAAPPVDSSSPSSVPVPLVVLGGMSLALLAAGSLGYVSRRRRAAAADELGDEPPADDDTLG